MFSYTLPGGTDPIGSEAGKWRVYKGRSWSCPTEKCRSGERHRNVNYLHAGNIGFRIMRVIP